jgi:hypothetical protein
MLLSKLCLAIMLHHYYTMYAIRLSLTACVTSLRTGESALMYCVGREGRTVPSAQVAFAVKLLKRGADRYTKLCIDYTIL